MPLKRTTLYIKNMVCPRCIETVKRIALELNLPLSTVNLGSVSFNAPLNENLIIGFHQRLQGAGFEIVEDSKTQQINQIKTLIIQRVHYPDCASDQNLSTFLSSKLNYDYSRLSKLFSSHEGITIERFATWQRIERAKELLLYNQSSIAEIADDLGYSSPAHFSAQFKRETDVTPSQFKRLRNPARQPIDSI